MVGLVIYMKKACLIESLPAERNNKSLHCLLVSPGRLEILRSNIHARWRLVLEKAIGISNKPILLNHSPHHFGSNYVSILLRSWS